VNCFALVLKVHSFWFTNVSLRFYENLPKNIEIEANGSFVQGTVGISQIPTRSGGPRRLAGGGTEPAAGAGGGTPVRKRTRGPIVQL
jgi:hypothetical protein